MKILVVPTDFSPAATNAANYAVDLALAINAEIYLFHAYQVPINVTDVPLVFMSVDEMQQSADKKIRKFKSDLEHITSGKVPIHAEAALGSTIDELQNLCERLNPFAVIMGTTGHSGIERALFGSTSLSAVRHLTWPVICVPKGKEYGNGIRKIGLACDLLDVEESTPFIAITNFVKELHAELHVLNVEQQDPGAEQAEQTAILGTAIHEVNPQFHFIDHNDIEDGLNEFAEKNNLDLIIAIPKKHSALEGLFKPSSTRQLVNESHIPVMCIHE